MEYTLDDIKAERGVSDEPSPADQSSKPLSQEGLENNISKYLAKKKIVDSILKNQT